MAKLSYGFVSVLTLMMAASGCARDSALAKSEVRPEHGSDVTVQSRPGLGQLAGNVSIADVAERVLPSVVTISTTVVQRQPAGMFPFFGGGGGERQSQGVGSGV